MQLRSTAQSEILYDIANLHSFLQLVRHGSKGALLNKSIFCIIRADFFSRKSQIFNCHSELEEILKNHQKCSHVRWNIEKNWLIFEAGSSGRAGPSLNKYAIFQKRRCSCALPHEPKFRTIERTHTVLCRRSKRALLNKSIFGTF